MFDEIDVTMANDSDLITRAEAVKAAVDWNVPSHEDVFDAIKCVIAVRMHAVPKVEGWISIKDRLPEHGKRYLIYATSEDNKIGRITTAAFGGHFALSGRCAYWKVTHWMPLPTPPEVNSCDD